MKYILERFPIFFRRVALGDDKCRANRRRPDSKMRKNPFDKSRLPGAKPSFQFYQQRFF